MVRLQKFSHGNTDRVLSASKVMMIKMCSNLLASLKKYLCLKITFYNVKELLPLQLPPHHCLVF
jgi:hypothetical protein